MRQLSEKAKELRNAYQREWKRRNPERARQYNQTYWEKKAKKAEEEQTNITKTKNETQLRHN